MYTPRACPFTPPPARLFVCFRCGEGDSCEHGTRWSLLWGAPPGPGVPAHVAAPCLIEAPPAVCRPAAFPVPTQSARLRPLHVLADADLLLFYNRDPDGREGRHPCAFCGETPFQVFGPFPNWVVPLLSFRVPDCVRSGRWCLRGWVMHRRFLQLRARPRTPLAVPFCAHIYNFAHKGQFFCFFSCCR